MKGMTYVSLKMRIKMNGRLKQIVVKIGLLRNQLAEATRRSLCSGTQSVLQTVHTLHHWTVRSQVKLLNLNKRKVLTVSDAHDHKHLTRTRIDADETSTGP